jgi:RNA polymerase sigma factor (sigma-70 family)
MSFETLVGRIGPTLKRITRKLNGHHAFFDDDDLYQEALIRLWMDYTGGMLGDKTDSYILQGCYFHLRNYLRKNQDHGIFLSLSNPIGEDGTSLEETLTSAGPFSHEFLEDRMEVEVGEEYFLTDREKVILSLLLQGLSMREIGVKVGVSHVMVLKIRNRIREKYGQLQGKGPLSVQG